MVIVSIGFLVLTHILFTSYSTKQKKYTSLIVGLISFIICQYIGYVLLKWNDGYLNQDWVDPYIMTNFKTFVLGIHSIKFVLLFDIGFSLLGILNAKIPSIARSISS